MKSYCRRSLPYIPNKSFLTLGNVIITKFYSIKFEIVAFCCILTVRLKMMYDNQHKIDYAFW